MTFQIQPIPRNEFAHLIGLSESALNRHGARRVTVDSFPGFPCRISLVDAPVGETVILTNYQHQANATPYRASHAVFLRETAQEVQLAPGSVPEVLIRRQLSVRAFDANHDIIEADVIDGTALTGLIEDYLDNPAVSYLHVHYAKRGCFAATVTRANSD